MSKRRSRVEENEIAVEILKVQALVLQRYAEDFEFGYIDARELRKRLNQQVRALLEVAEVLDREPASEDATTEARTGLEPADGSGSKSAA